MTTTATEAGPRPVGPARPGRSLPSPLALVVLALPVWAATRLFMATALDWWGYGHRIELTGDVDRYRGWSDVIAGGRLPVGDQTWQYPPGAAAVMALPRLLDGAVGYHRAFMLEMLLADAAVTAILTLLALRSRRCAGLWLWVLAGVALGPFLLDRFDLAPTALAVAGLAAAGRRPLLGGVLLALGGLVKVWPATVLPAAAGTLRRTLAVAVGAVLALLGGLVTLAATGLLGDATDFLRQQSDRGLEIEAPAATPWMLTHATSHGRLHAPVLRYGAFEVVAPGVSTVVTVCTGLGLLVSVVAVVAAYRGRPADSSDLMPLALATVLGLMVTARVLSAQYLVWAVGIAALALVSGQLARRARMLTAAVGLLLLGSCALTQLEFPLRFSRLLAGDAAATAALIARNALLVLAAALAVGAVTLQRRDGGRLPASHPAAHGGPA